MGPACLFRCGYPHRDAVLAACMAVPRLQRFSLLRAVDTSYRTDLRSGMGLRRPILLAASILLCTATSALAATPTLLSPANGASVNVVPPKGFANGDVPFRWSIVYPDCPGPDTIHSSYVEFRQAGSGEFAATQRGGPFLGNGSFTTPGNVFPQTKPIRYEWRVFWACGATDGFAGSQGRSAVFTFTVLPRGSAVQPTCAKLSGKERGRCLALRRRNAELERCAALKPSRRNACMAAARAAYRRATR